MDLARKGCNCTIGPLDMFLFRTKHMVHSLKKIRKLIIASLTKKIEDGTSQKCMCIFGYNNTQNNNTQNSDRRKLKDSSSKGSPPKKMGEFGRPNPLFWREDLWYLSLELPNNHFLFFQLDDSKSDGRNLLAKKGRKSWPPCADLTSDSPDTRHIENKYNSKLITNLEKKRRPVPVSQPDQRVTTGSVDEILEKNTANLKSLLKFPCSFPHQTTYPITEVELPRVCDHLSPSSWWDEYLQAFPRCRQLPPVC